MIVDFIKHWFGTCYDHLGKLILVNLLLFICTFPLIFINFLSFLSHNILFLLFTLSLTIIIISPLFSAISVLISTFGGDFKFRIMDLLILIKKHFLKSIISSFIYVLAFDILAVSFLFYSSGIIPEGLKTPALFASAISFCVLILLALSSIYIFPIIVFEDKRIFESIKRAVVFMLDNFIFTVFVFLSLIGINLTLFFTGVGIMVFMFSFTAVGFNTAYFMLDEKYKKIIAIKNKNDN